MKTIFWINIPLYLPEDLLEGSVMSRQFIL